MDLLLERIVGFILALLLLYSVYNLFNVLKNKETALSMVFLHTERISTLFGILVLSSMFTVITGVLYAQGSVPLLVEVSLNINVLLLLIFTYFLQKLMKGCTGKKMVEDT
ncbi:MAG: hypothetical protein CVV28_10550 [Methanobacteriales archaeon HGW-Methanobacteriales-1]|jgi:vacuolar-type H+-ATPase subunit I/STV1|nr:MAG: hypothetical protein CVV28_10550 [Methanobacteriales archaeon HGW-Methanobacteriales-1]